jgi:hypothetical protein
MITRRLFVLGGLCLCGYHSPTIASTTPPSCIFYEIKADKSGGFPGIRAINLNANDDDETLINKNGLVMVLSEMFDLLQIDVGFAFFDDDKLRPNAGALSEPLVKGFRAGNAKDGTIAIGRNLIQQIRRETLGFGAALTAVCAHECGHILQYKYILSSLMELMNRDNGDPIRVELHADFICGYFAAFRKREDEKFPAEIQAQTQFRYGDGKYEPVSHGTGEQRGDAVYAGFQLGKIGVLSPEDLTSKGLAYVTKLRL